ncbi:NAD(P)-binding protein [Coemansia reversa NRRL 1564]|uniref:NAD(P)-binding protein n=1 Tax=Coemansia reversa (strain ATCC 12441 / NRRL 1564) TaxID=763665 RepID=A0A2G5BFH7_COERN|nr:NAD(P)-binding protein [Coemansia reversa NRRL 1564]|eukprot:PIA17732.1 NAD(P)-binding protein [Coemansia reversa NRRL 1564]
MALSFWKNTLEKSNNFDWSQQKVVLTGGAHGVGLGLLRKISAMGGHIAVLDIAEIPEPIPPNTIYYKCDMSDLQQLSITMEKVQNDMGVATILINNAGTLCPKLVGDQNSSDITCVANVNFVAPMQLTRILLPGMLASSHAHIVFISSVLAYIGVPQLATYTASKSGLTIFYESLKLELRHRLKANHIKTTILFPSKIQTGMFEGLRLPQWLSPTLSTDVVIDAILFSLESGRGGEIYMPAFANLAPLYMFAPQALRDITSWVAGSIDTMRTFKGRAYQNA